MSGVQAAARPEVSQKHSSSAQLIQELFEKQVEITPDAVAAIFGSEKLTYATLNSKANQLAHYLKKAGLTLESRVGVCLERSADAFVALLGIFKAGGVYVPLDPDYPTDRLNYMLADSQVTVLLTNSDMSSRLSASAATTISMDKDRTQIEQERTSNLKETVHENNLAYVIYTSGSTGNPKGVMVDHRGLANTLKASRKRFRFDVADVMPCLASFSFDISLFELCNPICSGGTVVIWDQKDVLDVQLLAESLEEITILHCVTTLMRQLVSFLKGNKLRARKLRLVLVGGELVGVNLLEQMREVFPEAEVNVLYGPTETTMICAGRLITGPLDTPPIGVPIENIQLYVLDQQMNPVSHGSAGELYLGGAGLARGYLNRPDLTARSFVPNRFSGNGERLYRTGDLARWDTDGNLAFLGRVDRQVKIHGHRIELGEIEAMLEHCRGVAEAVVTVREDQPGRPRLVAYVIKENSGIPSPDTTWISPAINDYFDDLSPVSPRDAKEAPEHLFYQTISENVRDKTILLAGTSREELLLKACLEGGARTVYVAERTAAAHARINRLVQKCNFTNVFPFLLDNEVPAIEERIDFCISESFGDIGGSKGLEKCLQQLRAVIQPETIFYPQTCITYISAVELPESLRESVEFHDAAFGDARKIFAAVRYPFDLRVRVHQPPDKMLISNEAVFEQINSYQSNSDIAEAHAHQIQLTISRQATLSGFVLKLRLYGELTSRRQLDRCYETDAPVYVPVFPNGLQIEPGDRIEGKCVRQLSAEDSLHMDYRLEGRIVFQRGGSKSFFHRLPFVQPIFEANAFYKKLFSTRPIDEWMSNGQAQDTREFVRGLRQELKDKLPDFMVPSAIVKINRFPQTPNGKLDRQALPAPEYSSDQTASAASGPCQEILSSLFTEALDVSEVSPDDNFFEMGGDSVVLIQLIKRIRETFAVNLSIRAFFEAPTVAGVANHVLSHKEAQTR